MATDAGDLPDRITIEPMTDWDLKQVCAIERSSFHQPWTPEGFRAEMRRMPARCLVARDGFKIHGYLILWLLPPEIHILNIAVRPEQRRRGLARLLLEYMKEYGRELGVSEVFLEVRPSNLAAIGLYESMGFQMAGRRPNYYAEDREDALMMKWSR